mmetsp:Transcript_10763/g.15749  ORF Transcript_10763/g.15749 Transcript_10763/m.15749 type:complete len:319 (+) Transcript_10763:27-983(+)
MKDQPSKTEDKIGIFRILTYNLFLRPPLISTNGNDDYKNDRVKAFLKHIPQYDIIALQEVFGTLNGRQKMIIEGCKKEGLIYYTHLPATWTKFIDSGLFIFSRYPIEKSTCMSFSDGNHVDGWTNKGVIGIKIKYPRMTNDPIRWISKDDDTTTLEQQKPNSLWIFNTHLQANYDHHHQLSSYASIQKKQLTQIRKWLYKMNKRREPCVFVGDFNIDERSYLNRILHKSLSPHSLTNMFMHRYGYNPVTYGLTVHGKPVETVLTGLHEQTLNLTLDRLFCSSPSLVHELFVHPFYDNSSSTFTQLSDHHGLGMSLFVP